MTDNNSLRSVPIASLDEMKIHYLRQFINDCKEMNTKLFFIISPRYGAISNEEYQPVFDICKQEGYDVWDYYCDQRFVSDIKYFNDSYHLNSEGADAFSIIVATRIQDALNL